VIVLKSTSRARVKQLAFAPNGTAIAAAAGACGLLVWNELINGAKAEVLKTPFNSTHRIAYTPDGAYLLVSENGLCVVELATREVKEVPVLGFEIGFAPTPDSAQVVVCERHATNRAIRTSFWSLRKPNKPTARVTDDLYFEFGPFFVNDEDYLIAGWHKTKGLCMRTRSAKTGKLLSEATDVPVTPDHAVLSPDATRVACASGRLLHVLPVGGPFNDKPVAKNDNKKHFADLAYHPGGKYLATASNDGTIKFFDTATWEVARTFTWKTGKMRAVCFSPDGTLAAAGGEKGRVVVWDVDL
jgi:WD40 repeat protein